MNIKKIFITFFIFLILFSAMTLISAEEKSYSIDQAFVELTVENNGLLHVNETYEYVFDGEFNGVYRDIPLKSGESIDNIEVYASGAYPVLKESDKNGVKHLKIYLFADKAHTKKIRDCKVIIYINYEMKNVVTLFNDVGALQYKLWGDEWDVGVDSLTAKINLPGDKNNTYFFNPDEYTANSYSNNGTVVAETNSIPSGEIYEALVLMPVNDFNDATFAKQVHEKGKDKIIKNLNDSISSRSFWNSAYLILGLLSILSPIAAAYVYIRYGRETRVDYEAIYERELPSDDSPEIINALVDNKENIGEPNIKGFQASVMNLIDRKVLGLETQETNNSDSVNLLLDFSNVENKDLSLSEKDLINALYPFCDNEILNLTELDKKLSSQSNAKSFLKDYGIWANQVKNECLDKKSQYFDSKGSVMINVIGISGLIFGIIIGILGFKTNLSSGIFSIVGGIFLILFSIALLNLPEDIFGRWTKKGRLFYLKWSNFKKFLEDNSLIKEHPPESIVIWKKYLIYGAALGVSDKVFESMKLHVPNVSDYDDIFMYHYYGGYIMFNHAYATSKSSANPSSDSGGFGSFGGGSGGGGGGAF